MKIPVQVIENPLKSIEILTPESDWYAYEQYCDGAYAKAFGPDGENTYFAYNLDPWLQSLTFRLTYNNDETKDVKVDSPAGNEAQYSLAGYVLEIKDKQQSQEWTEGENQVTLRYMGQTLNANVKLKASTVASITADTNGFYYIEESDGYRKHIEDRWYYYFSSFCKQTEITVKYTNGTTETLSCSALPGGAIVHLQANDMADLGDSAPLQVGDNTLYITYRGQTASVTVPVLSKDSAPTLTITNPATYTFYSGVHSIYPYGMTLKVTHSDSDTAPETIVINEAVEFGNGASTHYVLPNGRTMDIKIPSIGPGEHTGTISYMGAEASFTYTIVNNTQSGDIVDMNIESIVCEAPTDDGIGTAFTVIYKNGQTCTITPAQKLKELPISFMNEMDGATNVRYLTKNGSGVFDLNLSIYKTSEGKIHSVWFYAHNAMGQTLLVGEPGEAFEAYHLGLNASATAVDNRSVGVIEGVFVDTKDAGVNGKMVSNSADAVSVSVVSGTADISATNITMDADATQSLAEANKAVDIATDVAALHFGAAAMAEIAQNASDGATLAVSCTETLPEGLDVSGGAMLEVTLSAKEGSKESYLLSSTDTQRDIRMTLPVPEALTDAETLYVYYLADDGTLALMESAQEDGKLVIETSHFSRYLLTDEKLLDDKPDDNDEPDATTPTATPAPAAGDSKPPKTGDDSPLGLMAALLALSALGMGAVLVLKKQRNQAHRN